MATLHRRRVRGRREIRSNSATGGQLLDQSGLGVDRGTSRLESLAMLTRRFLIKHVRLLRLVWRDKVGARVRWRGLQRQ